MWKVDGHRVKKKRIQTGTKTVLKNHGPPSFNSHHTEEPVYSSGFKCVDCEKEFESREEFKGEECYTVIYD